VKPIRIADQPRLGFLRTARITIDGIRYRLFRAAVTVAVIAMAVAFLMNIMSESLLKRAVGRDTPERLARLHLIDDWLARLTKPGTAGEIIGEAANAEKGGAVYGEIAAMAGFGAAEMAEFHGDAVEAARYLAFFDGLDYARRRSLVHAAAGMGILGRLATDSGWERFTKALDTMRSLRSKPEVEELRKFVRERRPKLLERAGRVRAGRLEAIAKAAAARGGRDTLEALADAGGSFGESVRQAGFALDARTVAPRVAEQARRIIDSRAIKESIRKELIRQIVARHHNVLPGDVTLGMLWDLLSSRKGGARYIERMKKSGVDISGMTPERLVKLSQLRREEVALVKAARLTAGVGGGWMGLGERMGWLLLVSMLVCMIGISNAMLMTVTERFREIATLKCLGALDGFIMGMFVLESCVLGIVGGTIGAVLGSVIGLGRMLVTFGAGFVTSIPVPDVLAGMFIAVGTGVVLAAVAAVYPALKAARLAPMEAMRIE